MCRLKLFKPYLIYIPKIIKSMHRNIFDPKFGFETHLCCSFFSFCTCCRWSSSCCSTCRSCSSGGGSCCSGLCCCCTFVRTFAFTWWLPIRIPKCVTIICLVTRNLTDTGTSSIRFRINTCINSQCRTNLIFVSGKWATSAINIYNILKEIMTPFSNIWIF